MIIVRRKSNGEVKEVPLTDDQYEKIKDCLSSDIECISCQLHHNEGTDEETASVWYHSKWFHVTVHCFFTVVLFAIPFLLPHLHVDPGVVLGAGATWTGAYSTFFAWRLDKEGIHLK